MLPDSFRLAAPEFLPLGRSRIPAAWVVRNSFRSDAPHLQELRALGGAAQPAGDEQLVAETSDPEHSPADLNSAALHAQGDALIQAVEELGYYPNLSRDIVCWSKLWDAIGEQEPAVEKLLKDVLYFGRLPHQIKKSDY